MRISDWSSDVCSSDLMWTPVTPMPITPLPDALKPAQPTQQAYALGWQVQDYRGHRIVQHGGGVFGSITRDVLIPDKTLGSAIMMHSKARGLLIGLSYALLDHYLCTGGIGWNHRCEICYQYRVPRGG